MRTDKLLTKTKKGAGTVLKLLIRACILAGFVWAAGAVFYLLYLPNWIRVLLCLAYCGASGYLLFRSHRRGIPDRGFAIVAATIPAVWLATLPIQPSNDREWTVEQSQLPEILIDRDKVTIHNFRNSSYRSEADFDVHYTTKRLRLSSISEVWYVVQKFSAVEGLAHTFVSIGYRPDPESDSMEYLSVSVEIRREKDESYSPWKGIFRNYEINYVVGDERDLIGVRTVHRPDDRVFLYRTNATADQAQKMFLGIAARTEKLKSEPEFYNTFLNNCTNSLVEHSQDLTPEPVNWLNPRVVFPGYSHIIGFRKGLIGDRAGGETLKQLNDRSRIDNVARELAKDGLIPESFSNDLRAGHR